MKLVAVREWVLARAPRKLRRSSWSGARDGTHSQARSSARKNRAVLLAVLAFPIAGCPAQPQMMPMFDTGSGSDTSPGLDGGSGDAAPGDDSGMDAGMPAPDAGMDAGSDAGTPSGDAGLDAPLLIDANRMDGGGTIATSDPAPAPTVVHVGTSGLILRGTVLTPAGPLAGGEVLVVGNTIACVATDCSGTAGASTASIIDTHATISPGLIDAHNHLTYDFLPEWVPPHLYQNRYQWRNDPSYSAWVDPEGDSNNDGTQDTGAQCPGAKWGELRSIIHGTTTVQGQAPQSACLDRLARNADHYHGLGADIARTTISGACESGFPSRTSLLTDFTSHATTRFYVHMGEGYMNPGTATRTDVLREFGCYAGTDTLYPAASLLEDGTGMPYGASVFIHAMPLTAAQLDQAVTDQVRIVWSPSSNIVLYDQTADIAGMLSRGLVVGLGPDWTPSGSDEMLSEMRFAQQYGHDQGIGALTAEQIWRMATIDGADVVGLPPIGTLAVGQRADIAVFGRTSADPYQAVLDSRAADVRLVLIDGLGYYGDAALQATTAVNSSCEAFDACGTMKYLCAANTPGSMTATSRFAETVADIRGQLTTILASYSRTDLLELVDCSL